MCCISNSSYLTFCDRFLLHLLKMPCSLGVSHPNIHVLLGVVTICNNFLVFQPPWCYVPKRIQYFIGSQTIRLLDQLKYVWVHTVFHNSRFFLPHSYLVFRSQIHLPLLNILSLQKDGRVHEEEKKQRKSLLIYCTYTRNHSQDQSMGQKRRKSSFSMVLSQLIARSFYSFSNPQ